MVTRVLYRLRFLSDQRPLDAVSLAYCFPLVFLVLEKGGIGRSEPEEADEQLILAIEFISFHTNSCMYTSPFTTPSLYLQVPTTAFRASNSLRP
jgi:hypothetical protein